MIEIQKWLLENNNDFDKLKLDYGINSRIYDDRVVLNYSQIDSPKHHPIVKECRSLILYYPDTSKIMNRSFDRFYNYFEDQNYENFPIIDSKIYTKEDGSLIHIYYDGKKLCISSKSMAFAEGLNQSKSSYYNSVLNINPNLLKQIEKNYDLEFLKKYSFILELCSKSNKIVKLYDNDKLFLLAVRNKENGEYILDEEVNEIAKILNLDRPENKIFDSYKSIQENIKFLPAMDEGYVCNYKNWRIKIKNPAYIILAHLKNNLEPKNIIKLIFMNEHYEYLEYFPEHFDAFKPYIDIYEKINLDVDVIWEQYKYIEDQKSFAEKIKDLKIKSILFSLRNRKNSKREILEQLSDNSKIKLVKEYQLN